MNLKFIDSLRGWAILAVLFFHCGEFGDNHQLPKKLVSIHYHGAYGVQLFYIISSFTLFYSHIAKRKNENFDWKTYGARRFFRIAPLYYCSIIYYLYQYSIGYGYFLEGNTFTISNLGMFGIDEFTSIINSPDGAILSVGAIQEIPVVKNGAVVPGNVMKLTLGCDHRVVDGATGAAFLQTLKGLLEEPIRLLA